MQPGQWRRMLVTLGMGVFGWLGSLAAFAAGGEIPKSADGQAGVIRGVTRCDADLNLALPVAGRIAVLHVEDGTVVEQGKELLSLERSAEEYDVERRRVQWQGQAELKAARARQKTAEQQAGAARRVYETSQGISKEELDNRELALTLASAEVARLQNTKEMERLDYLTARENLERRTLRAPSRGIVVKVVKQPGESIQANETVLRLCDLQRILFIAHLPLDKSERLQVGDAVFLRVGTQQNRVEGKVLFVSPVVDASSWLREVKIEMGSPAAGMRPGMPASLELPE
ncbi:MAG: efflux RND transporter periplasmic adaptor subunit [Magnetococcales bacterium]|nr:efflux RND transporter periplasmic adaptor subunit [Magnetococcales bacterium]